jgi:YggT family protein
MLLARLFDVYSLVVLAAVILSWIRLPPENPLVRVTSALTEPLLSPIRRVLPEMSGIDLSPMVLLLGLRLLRGLLLG